MEEKWLSYIIDGLIILVGALLSLNSIIQLIIELKVKNQEGNTSYSRIKLVKHLLLLCIGVVLIVTRVLYIIDRNSWLT